MGQKVADALDIKAGDDISFFASGHRQDEGRDDSGTRMIICRTTVLADLPTVQSLLSRPES